jgi:protein phosphatase PTC7
LPEDGATLNDRLTHLAISDGVGGWSDKVDPSLFSQGLMYHYAKSARTGIPSPLDHLRNAYRGVLNEDVVTAGGATACGIALNPNGSLQGVK